MANKRSISQKDEKIRELENEILANKEKIRMNTQLTQALSDSVKREEQLKKQCDQLLESLHSALGEDEKLAAKITQLEDHTEYLQKLVNEKDKEINSLKGVQKHSPKTKKSELSTYIENDIENGSQRWKQLKLSLIHI